MEIKTKIVIFDDGTYFNGVKGKRVRTTKHFPDAKRIDGELSDRDLRYLEKRRQDYTFVNVTMKLEICSA